MSDTKSSIINYLVLYWKPLVWSLFFLLIIGITNQFFVLPINGIYLIAYFLIIAVSATWGSIVAVQSFLEHKKPLDYIKVTSKSRNERNNPDLRCVKRLTAQIDEYFIKKWFIYISDDNRFSEECKTILEEVLTKLFNVVLFLDHQSIVHGILNLYLKHLKEFRRALKRREKYGGNLSDLYR